MSKQHECNEKKSKSDADRLSGLPESILHHILSFLETKQVAQASILSKRWRYLWMSVPNLSFDHRMWKPIPMYLQNQDGMGKRKRGFSRECFRDFVDKVLLLRDDSNVHRFRLLGGDYCNSGKIETWVSAVVRRHVQELHLDFTDCGQPLLVPNDVFTSTIRMFTLRSSCWKVELHLPNSLCFSTHLKFLELVLVTLPQGDSNGELVLGCPVLETLIIENCVFEHLKVFNISAFQLKSLDWNNYRRGYNCKIKMCAPNLTSFQMKDSTYDDFSLDNLSSLVSARIDVNSQCFVKVLKGVYKAKTMTLSCGYLWTLSQFPDRWERLPEPFHNLKYLRLTEWRACFRVCALVNLLESFPYLETLILEIAKIEYESTNSGGDQGTHLVSHCMFYHLKSVEVHNLQGCENELKYLEYILGNAVVLENITITTIKRLAKYREKMMENFIKKLRLLPRASSVLQYHFT